MNNMQALGAAPFDMRMYFTMKVHWVPNSPLFLYDGKDSLNFSNFAEPDNEFRIDWNKTPIINDFRYQRE